MFAFIKSAAETAALQAQAAQTPTKIEKLIAVNDDTPEVKYHQQYYGRDEAEETTA